MANHHLYLPTATQQSMAIFIHLLLFLCATIVSASKLLSCECQTPMSAFANSLAGCQQPPSLLRQLRALCAGAGGRRRDTNKRHHQPPLPPQQLQMSTTLSPQPSSSVASQAALFALPPDNFSRYSQFLVKTSNVVDGMSGGGQHHHLNKNGNGKKETLPWVDTLGVDNRQSNRPFSILSWNILAQSLYESNHRTKRIKQVALSSITNHTPLLHLQQPPHSWSHRLQRIIQLLSHSNSDIICLQECELHSFTYDLAPAMDNLGYDCVAQEDERNDSRFPSLLKEISKHRDPRNHITATFWKRNKFTLVGDVSVRTRSLTTVLRMKERDCRNIIDLIGEKNKVMMEPKKEENNEEDDNDDNKAMTTIMPTVAVVNCHLEGHPKRFLERTSQLQHALSDLSKRIQIEAKEEKKKSSHDRRRRSSSGDCGGGGSKLNALILAGDFNCELQSSACSTYLRMGRLGRQAGLGGIHGEDSLVLPPSLLETSEAAEILHPIIEWGRALPDEMVGEVSPHPFRRNGMTSAYPVWLGKDDAREHFTYCGENRRPVPGLDQLWYSSMTIERVGLKRMFVDNAGEWRCISDENVLAQLRDYERRKVLSTGLPSPDCKYPSDHLPIGAIFDWKLNNCGDIRRLQIVDDEGNNVEDDLPQDEPTALEKDESFDTPNQELEFLIRHCPFDSLEQQSDVNFLLSPINPPIDMFSKAKPTPDQMEQLDIRRKKKTELLKSASLGVRPWLKKIWKVEKQVGKWERQQSLMKRK